MMEELQVPEEKIRVIYSGVGGNFVRVTDGRELGRVREKYHLPAGFTILNVGTNLRYKNLEGLIRAFADFLKLAPEAWLIKAGPDFTKEQQELISQLGVGQKIRSLGFVPWEDLIPLYSSVSLLASPSWEEGFGWTPLEAAACGCPVVISDRCGLAEASDGTGAVVIDPGKAEEIVKAFVQVKTQLARGEFNREQLMAIAQKFSWRECARKTLAVYEDLFRSLGA